MKKIQRRFINHRAPTFLFLSIASIASLAQVTNTFTYTGAPQTFTVPPCVNALSVSIAGARGGNGLNSSVGPGGFGGHIAAVISVTPGQVLNLYVGGMGANASPSVGAAGGYNGGGAGGSQGSLYAGGGGGGASDIRISPYTLSDRIIVAGGGGGGGTYTNTSAGYERGGAGGTANGGSGFGNNSNSNGNGGSGGGNISGGAGGFMSSFCTAQSGSLGLGGAANTCSNGGGGGGGGYYGGGGGIAAGGGGGSNYAVLSSSTVVHSLGASPGNGSITISYIQTPPTINIAASSTNVCSGSPVSFTASGGVNYTWTTIPASQTITGQNIISNTFTTAGAYAVNVSGSSTITGCSSSAMVAVIVNAGPPLVANASRTINCSGNSTTLSANGANLYQWDANTNSATTATTLVNPTVLTQYVVSGTLNSTGCSSTASVTVHIYVPTVAVTGNASVCSGQTVTLNASVINPASGSTNSYTWYPGGLNPIVGPAIQITPSLSTIYTISAKSVTNGNVSCVGSATVPVTIYNNPTISVVPSKTFICRGEQFTLIANGALTYTWNNGAFAGNTLTIVHNQIGTYPYTVTGTSAEGCVADKVYYVKIIHCHLPGGIEEFDQNNNSIVVYPNPNNGEFNIISNKDMTLKLTNRLGQIVREIEVKAYIEQKIHIEDLVKGIYFISSSNTRTRQKIVIQ
ncbi:MAG: T9SS type A sorting domain-containing protein [Bacteroidia bacterium]|nr:T9SS type A sorting domain-containing protein [Bacteroidia bacterium]